GRPRRQHGRQDRAFRAERRPAGPGHHAEEVLRPDRHQPRRRIGCERAGGGLEAAAEARTGQAGPGGGSAGAGGLADGRALTETNPSPNGREETMKTISRTLALMAGAAALLAWGADAAAQKSAAKGARAAAAVVEPTVSPPGWKSPRNAMGQPDLSGYWSNATMTPLTRNAKLTDKLVIPAAQAASLEKVFAEALAAADAPTDQKKGPGQVTDPNSPEAQLVKIRPDFAAAGGDVGGYNTFWIDPGNHMMEVNGEYRSSIITTPNGLPPARKAAPTA